MAENVFMEHLEFIGRKPEQAILREALASKEAEMVAVIGRRRVGKTLLIKTVYDERIVFQIAGTQHASKQDQLQVFSYQLQEYVGLDEQVKKPKNWLEAFHFLIQFLKTKKSERKQVVFFDELPWLATKRSGFLSALSFFWNNWAVNQNIVVVICGSAASWMIQKVVNHKGGLHNRVTRLIQLYPFTLAETEAYFQSRNVSLNRYHITQLYMAMGGIPYYLKEVKSGEGAVENINRICFSPTGLLRKEFTRLYVSLFKNSENHIAIIRALATTWRGLHRNEIIQLSKLSDGGRIKRILEELEQSGFISLYYPFGKKKNGLIYRLTDEYSLFYLKFIETKKTLETEVWQKLSQTQTYKSWSGYAFEGICLKHIAQIKKAMSIGGVYTETTSFYKKGTEESQGTQIDLLIDRNDQVINLFEIKFYNAPFEISKAYALNLRTKLGIFQQATKTRKQVFINLISSFPLIPNKHSIGLIDKALTLDDLFED
ncbi:MAG: ATP-binding protein [Bacteroidota bacterium]